MGYEQVGIYSFYFRIAGISVTIYMFIYIAFFKKLYLSDPLKLDKYFSALMSVVLFFCILFYFASPILIGIFFKDFENIDGSKLLLLLSLQMPIWTGIALNEGIISRENILNKMNAQLIIIVLFFPILLFLLKERMTLDLFTFLNIIIFCIAYASQLYILQKKNIYLRKCMVYNLITVILSIIIYIFN